MIRISRYKTLWECLCGALGAIRRGTALKVQPASALLCVILTGIVMMPGTRVLAQPSETIMLEDGESCGRLENAYGPFDYTNPTHRQQKLPIVDLNHFNRAVETLERGMTAALPGGDLDYTLRAFPNHHRALNAMARYQLQYSNDRVPPGARYSGECYLARALAFSPRDPVVHLIYGIYLEKRDRLADALQQYEEGLAIAPDYAELHYTMGLLSLRLDRPEDAVKHAQRAYELGYPLPGLKRKLQARGLWEVSGVDSGREDAASVDENSDGSE